MTQGTLKIKWSGTLTVFFLSLIFAVLFVNVRTIYMDHKPTSISIEDYSAKSYLDIGRIDLALDFLGSSSVTLSNFRNPFGVIPLKEIVFNIDDFDNIDESSIISKEPSFTLHLKNSSVFVLNFDVSSENALLMRSGEKQLTITEPTTLRITPDTQISIIADNLLSPPEGNLTKPEDATTFYGKHRVTSYSSSPHSYLFEISMIVAKAIVFFLLLLALFVFVIFACAQIGRNLLRLFALKSNNVSAELASLLGFFSLALLVGSLNYFLPGSIVRQLFWITLFAISAISYIKQKHQVALDLRKLLNIFMSGGALLGTLIISAVTSFIYKFWNIGLINTDTNGYYFQILDSLEKPYLGQPYEEYRGNFTGYGMRTLDHSVRMLFHFGNSNQTIVTSSIFMVILAMSAVWDYSHIDNSKNHREVLLFLVPSSGLLAGLWMEGYQTRWFGAVLGIICITILASLIFEIDQTASIIKFVLIILLSVAQLSLNPTFFVVPFFATTLSFYLIYLKKVKCKISLKVKFIIAAYILLVSLNLLWIRDIAYTIEQGTNRYLDQLANNFVLPFWNTLFILPLSFGVVPWHNNMSSIYNIGTDKISIIFHNSFFGILLEKLLAIEIVPKNSLWSSSFIIYLVILSLILFIAVTSTILQIRTFPSCLVSQDPRIQIRGLWNVFRLLSVILFLQMFIQFLFSSSRLYVNSMTVLSQMPIVIFFACLLLTKIIFAYSGSFFALKRISSFLALVTFACSSTVTSVLEYGRWNSGYKTGQGFSYWSYHDLLIGDVSLSPKSNSIFLRLNPVLSDWDEYLVSNLTYRTLYSKGGLKCLNCQLRNNEVVILSDKSELNYIHPNSPKCSVDEGTRFVEVCIIDMRTQKSNE